MSKILITGRQGTGKTTVIKELQNRQFSAYNTDDMIDVTKLQDKVTGEVIAWPDGAVDWSRYSWNWQKDALEELLQSDETVFVGGIVSNQTELYNLFDKIFVLTITEENVRQRLATHEHETHHMPGELERIAGLHVQKQKELLAKGGEAVDGNHPIDQIVDDILSRLNLER